MPPNPNFAELQYRTQVKEHLAKVMERELFHRTTEVLKHQINAIADDHKALIKSNFRGFSYKGKEYWGFIGDALAHPELHHELHTRMENYLTLHTRITEYEQPIINNYLRGMFAHTDWLDDYHQMLPDSLHSCFTPYEDVFRKPDARRMPPDDLAEFLVRNRRYIQLMRERMLLNLLL